MGVKEGFCDCKPFCTYDYRPVCGTNGVEYGNKCAFDAALCEAIKNNEKPFEIRNEGKCCKEACTFEYRPVCGSNGITYSNNCLFKLAQCKAFNSGDGHISLVNKGSCECKFGCGWKYSPVCGTNKNTYSNKCLFEWALCRASRDGKELFEIAYEGPCEKYSINFGGFNKIYNYIFFTSFLIKIFYLDINRKLLIYCLKTK